MVTIKENAIRFEAGISYQWAVDAHDQAVRGYRIARESVVTRYRAAVVFAVAVVESTRARATETRESVRASRVRAVESARDRAAAMILGVTVQQVGTLRRLVLNPPSAVPAVRAKAQATPQAIPAAITGANVRAKDLLDAVQRIGRCVSSRTSLPILSCVLIRAEAQELIISATDLEVGAETRIPAVVRDFAGIAVPAKLLQKSIDKAGGAINLTVEDGKLVLTDGARVVRLETLPADEFPQLPAMPTAWQDASGLVGLIERVMPAASYDETRAILTGVHVQAGRVAATDTHRLAIADHAGLESWTDAIVPARACDMLARITGYKPGGQIEIGATESNVWFRTGTTIMVSRLIEGQFPNCDRVIPRYSAVL